MHPDGQESWDEWEQLELFPPSSYLAKPTQKPMPDTEPCIWCGKEVPTKDIEEHEEECSKDV